MPNWCECELGVSGPKIDLTRFLAQARQGDRPLSFQPFVPRPPELDIASDGFGSIGYDAWYGDAEKILSYPWVVQAGVKDVEELRQFLEQKDPAYHQQADTYAHNIAKYGAPTWYEWNVKHWGTKWEPEENIQVTNDSPSHARFLFSTAWSPPLPVIRAMAAAFPTLAFSLNYWEGGCGFQGTLHAEFGEILEDNSYPYHGSRGG